MSQLYGNIIGLKANQIRKLQLIYRRRIPSNLVITSELARYLAELSREIGRQIGIIVNRRGTIVCTIIGNEKEIVIPVLSDYPLGRKRLRGIRCIHTHLKNEPLSQDDITDLSLLRFDIMAAIGVAEDGLPGNIYLAHILPLNSERKTYDVHPPVLFQNLNLKMDEFIEDIENEMDRAIVRDVNDNRERAILVSVFAQSVKSPNDTLSGGDGIRKNSREEQIESVEELKELARSANVAVLETIIQRPKEFNPKYLMGSGKIRELVINSLQKDATLIIFDQELTSTQMREIGEVTELKVIDRTQLIHDIFARRAHSRDGKTQVELAQLKYRLSKLTGKGSSMSRLAGGIGGRGPGETKLEVDRRRIQERISHLEKQLKNLSRGRFERRRSRSTSGIPIISIVGYTNAGKTTLLNSITNSDARVESLLFATLDTASRRLRFPRERDAVITDTVGFIRHLPKDLLKAFKATLEEMEDADLLIHLVDISNPSFEGHIKVVEDMLEEIGLNDIERLIVFNKKDLVDEEIVNNLCRRYDAVAISAVNKETLNVLMETLERKLMDTTKTAIS